MDEKILNLALSLGDNTIWALALIQGIDLIKHFSFLALICFGVKWLIEKIIETLKDDI